MLYFLISCNQPAFDNVQDSDTQCMYKELTQKEGSRLNVFLGGRRTKESHTTPTVNQKESK